MSRALMICLYVCMFEYVAQVSVVQSRLLCIYGLRRGLDVQMLLALQPTPKHKNAHRPMIITS